MRPAALFLLVAVPALWADESTGARLAAAMHEGNLRSVEALLAAGFDPNAPMAGGPLIPFQGAPLQYAVQLDDPRIAARLIAAGANVNARSATGRTALHYAI